MNIEKPKLGPNSLVGEGDLKEKCEDCGSSLKRTIFGKILGCYQPECKSHFIKPLEMNARDLIKYLNSRKNWHGKQYRSLCGQWLGRNPLNE